MNLPLAYLTNSVLLVRLPLFMRDEPVRGRAVLVGTLVQLVALLAFEPGPGMLAAAAVGVILNASAWALERRRRGMPLLFARLAVLAAYAACLAILGAPFLGLQLRADLAGRAATLGRYCVPFTWLATASWPAVHTWLLGALLSLNEANLLVRLLISRVALRPASAADGLAREIPAGGAYAHGRAIGLLERLLVFVLVAKGEFGALGLVIGVKGLARFKNLDDREFAEYFLIGTMLSIVVAGAIGLMVRGLLP